MSSLLYIYLYLFLSFRSSLSAREDPSLPLPSYKLKCVCCGKIQHNKVTTKYRISEAKRAEELRTAANALMDDTFTRICDLTSNESMFSADLYYHNFCYNQYIRKYKKRYTEKQDISESYKITFKSIVTKHIPFGAWKWHIIK